MTNFFALVKDQLTRIFGGNQGVENFNSAETESELSTALEKSKTISELIETNTKIQIDELKSNFNSKIESLQGENWELISKIGLLSDAVSKLTNGNMAFVKPEIGKLEQKIVEADKKEVDVESLNKKIGNLLASNGIE